MNRCSLCLVLVLSALAYFSGTSTVRAADAFVVDPAHSSVVFKIQHAGISWIFGRFNEFSGDFMIDKQDPSNSSFALNIKASSIDTNNAKRDEHLRSPDFFNTKQFPTLTFKSTSAKRVEKGYEVTGDFTMHGVTKQISFVLEGGGKEVEFPKGRKRLGFTAALTLRRADFGMEKFVGMLGEDVHVEVGVEVVQKQE
jgi:polyisoprenoid-binding protein YceI